MAKPKELRQYSKKELEEMLLKNKKKLDELLFNLASGKLKDIREIRVIKKDIARIMTILTQIAPKQSRLQRDATGQANR